MGPEPVLTHELPDVLLAVELFAPSSRVFTLTNAPTISGIQDMFPYDRNPL